MGQPITGRDRSAGSDSGSVARGVSLAAQPAALVRVAAAVVASAGLWVLAFPEPDLGWLAWIAFVPLCLALRGASAARGATIGFACGALAWLGICRWIFEVDAFGPLQALPLAVYLSLYPAAWGAGVAWIGPRATRVVVAPALWVVLDWLQGHAGFLAFPWATLAHTQHANAGLLPLARFTGEAGVTFAVVLGSVSLAALVGGRRERRAGLAALCALAALHAGLLAYSASSPSAGPKLRVAVVQPAFPRHASETPEGLERRIETLASLSRQAAASRPDLIVWPESAVRRLAQDPALGERLAALAESTGASLILGSSDAAKFRPSAGPARMRAVNAAHHLTARGSSEPPYHKMRLVPFGEYLPLSESVSWPTWLAPRAFDVTAGEMRRSFMLADGTRAAPLICWENLFADFVRPAVRDGARLLVHLSNDNWFGRSAEARQHARASVLRAVENGVPLVLASNTGPSQILDARGRVLAELPVLMQAGTLVADVPLTDDTTFYTRFGDGFVGIALALVVAGAIGRVRRRRGEWR